MIVLFASAGVTVVGTWLVAYRQVRQGQHFMAVGSGLLAELADDPR